MLCMSVNARFDNLAYYFGYKHCFVEYKIVTAAAAIWVQSGMTRRRGIKRASHSDKSGKENFI